MTDGKLILYLRSFSYKTGIPAPLDENGGGFIFDCRCLPNPGREERYKNLTGLDAEVIQYLDQKKQAIEYWDHVYKLVRLSVKAYQERGFSSLSVFFGCTGGQHRSVYFAEKLKFNLQSIPNLEIDLEHIQIIKGLLKKENK